MQDRLYKAAEVDNHGSEDLGRSVPSKLHAHLQSGIVPINVGVPVVGDVTVAVWFGSYKLGQRMHSRPALAFAFHTAFADPGSVRIKVGQLDLADAAIIPPEAAAGFFIDVILTEQTEVGERRMPSLCIRLSKRSCILPLLDDRRP